MADSTTKLSGYLTTAQTVSFTGTQTLNALADNEYTDLSDAINNSSNLYALADFEIYLDTLTPTTDANVALYIIPSIDGTNYADWTGNTATETAANEQYFVGGFVIPIGTSITPRAVLRNVLLPNGYFKVAVRNACNVALASTANNTLKYRPHGYLADEA